MTSTRQLAAIMFTDIVGYTSLMGKDEQRAFELLTKNREIQKPIVEQHNGRWIKELGDGVMASFPNVSDAVYAAIKIQKECVSAEDLLLRIGIHLGEVVFEHDDVFGDGVNIASRIQAIAPPGGIWISETVRHNVTNKNDIVTEFVKVERLKNVKEPIRIYQVTIAEAGTSTLLTGKQSIIPGYQYDVFISYSQKDNKGDRWVSEFAEMVKAELDATFKEDVSIYFDESPHDRLMEADEVDESHKEKLKCLVFVPIISQTYCDARSFIWQHEFLLFLQMAAKDKFGLTIKALSGTATSRVVPVRIHELEAADMKLLEDEVKTKLRPIDFIFKSPGVNRPLRSNEEDPLKNAYRTTYRDQINKTANVIKDLLGGLKNADPTVASSARSIKQPVFLTNLGKSLSQNSLAILPFTNKGKEEDDFLGDSIADEIISLLTPLRSVKVASRVSAFQFRDKTPRAQLVGEQLNVGLVISGNITRHNKSYDLKVDGLKASDGIKLWSLKFQGPETQLAQLIRDACQGIVEKMGFTLKDQERSQLVNLPTEKNDAYLQYLEGRSYSHRQGEELRRALTHFTKAVSIDSQFALALSGLAECNILMGYYDLLSFPEAVGGAKQAAFKATKIDATLIDAFVPLSFVAMCYELSWPEIEPVFNRVFAQNPFSPTAADRLGRYRDQIEAHLTEAEAEPLVGKPYYLQAFAFLHHGKFEDALKVSLQAREAEPESYMANRAVGLSYMGLENYDEAIDALLTASRLSNRQQGLLFELMAAYSFSGKQEEAQAIAEEVMAGANALPARIYNFFFPGT